MPKDIQKDATSHAVKFDTARNDHNAMLYRIDRLIPPCATSDTFMW
jgi:hypothetical protein